MNEIEAYCDKMARDYRSAKSGRFVVHFIEFTYFSKHGFALEERRRRTLGLRVTHWMRIPPINKV